MHSLLFSQQPPEHVSNELAHSKVLVALDRSLV
jgi:hypothetical protein